MSAEPESELLVSEEEQRGGTLSGSNHVIAGLFLHCRGYVILRKALSVDLVERLRCAFAGVYDDCRASSAGAAGRLCAMATRAVFFERASRWRIFPRLEPPFDDVRVVANPLAVLVMRDLLGDDLYCKSVSSDTCVSGAMLQSPHRDIEFYKSGEPYGAIVNIPLVHCGTHNGPLEVWPGSQFWHEKVVAQYGMKPFIQDGRNPVVEQLASHLPSRLLELWPGDLLVRDPGMWHRGTPTLSSEPRTMLTMAYFRRDYRYGYGHARYNVDDALFANLAEPVKTLLEHSFREPDDLA
jgi:ectoine hydroxylase-related dioxygenase (phytanoyl-CoA dioxygenase family)